MPQAPVKHFFLNDPNWPQPPAGGSETAGLTTEKFFRRHRELGFVRAEVLCPKLLSNISSWMTRIGHQVAGLLSDPLN